MSHAVAVAAAALAREQADRAAHVNYMHHLDEKPSSYQFYYKTNPTAAQLTRGPLWGVRRFTDILENCRCTYNTKKGVRCGRRTVFGVGYCWQHLEDKKYLKIAPSLITKPKKDRYGNVMHNHAGHVIRESIGKGVFVDAKGVPQGVQVFAADALIMGYDGQVITEHEVTLRYGNFSNPYSLQGTRRVLNERTKRWQTRIIRDAPIVDSALMRGVPALINHKPHNQANCRFTTPDHTASRHAILLNRI